MATEVIPDEITTDRDRGHEIIGMRLTVYHLLPYFLDPTVTEEYICRVHELTPAQVSSARSYIMNHWDEVWARHLEIEARIAAGNPPEVLEKADELRPLFLEAKARLERRIRGESPVAPTQEDSENPGRLNEPLPSFVEWLAERRAVDSRGS